MAKTANQIEKRQQQIISFLNEAGLSQARRAPLASDASFRKYERLFDGNQTYMLMDADPEKEKIEPFIAVDQFLVKQGFSAPKIHAQHVEHGFLLLEDLGYDSFTNLLLQDVPPVEEFVLYKAAVDVLITLAKVPVCSEVPDYTDELLLRESQLLTEWYLPFVQGIHLTENAKQEYTDIWRGLLQKRTLAKKVLVLRDYHADNLMWLAGRSGTDAVGLLDFQDAVIGSPVYDLVSLLEDARRDVSHGTVTSIIDYYMDKGPCKDKSEFDKEYALLAAQRNCKIIGIFGRLAARDKKTRYLHYLPRVWRHLEHDLRHPALSDLKIWLDQVMTKEQRDVALFSAT